MPSLKDVKMKIVGVGKTKQITKAMNMVASAKLRGAQTRIENFRPYASKYQEVLAELASKAGGSAAHPLLSEHTEKKNCAIVMVTSDRGLCGSFNANIIGMALRLAAEKKAAGMEVHFACIGRKGREAASRAGYNLLTSYSDRMGSIDFALASSVAQEIIHGYESLNFDEAWLVYGEFLSMGQQPPRNMQLLPVTAEAIYQTMPEAKVHAIKTTAESEASGSLSASSVKAKNAPSIARTGSISQSSAGQAGGSVAQETTALADSAKYSGGPSEYVYEPQEEQLLAELLPRYVRVQVYRGLLDTSASEHAARMSAMDNATRNCNELIRSLTLLYNKTRQASITSELIDIVGGAEALNG